MEHVPGTEGQNGRTNPKSGILRGRSWLRYLLSTFFILAGVNHFISPEWYMENQMPPWIPMQLAVLYVSGIAEIIGGLGLLLPRFRVWAGRGLVALLVAVFPGNIHMLHQALQASAATGELLMLLLRLPLQAVFIVAVLWSVREPLQSEK